MLRHSYDNCKINHTISQKEKKRQTCDQSYDILRQILRHFVNRARGRLSGVARLSTYKLSRTFHRTTTMKLC